MPASANWPERTLISPILTVPCALADETPSSSATAQPKPTRIRFIVILPVLAAEQLQKLYSRKFARSRSSATAAVGAAPPSQRRAPRPQHWGRLFAAKRGGTLLKPGAGRCRA